MAPDRHDVSGSISAESSRASGIRRRGFTILEVMIAAAIMVLAIGSSLVTLQQAFLSLDTARNLTLAGQIMVTEMEKSRMNDWATVSAYPAGPTTLTIDPSFTNNAAIGD